MRRNAAHLFVCLVLTSVLAGCSTTKQSDTGMYASDSSGDMYAPSDSAANDPYADPYAGGGSSDTYGSAAADPGYGSTTAGARYHTVAKKDTLYSLARTYYNDQRRWKEIYEANSGTLSDPNKIFVGQRLVIP